MPGNSRRRGAIRKPGTKKGPTVGSGGVRRRGLEGRGATPPAHLRPNHPAAKRAAAKDKSRRGAKKTDETEMVLGRNPVLECLRAGVPANTLYVALGTDADERLTESVRRAADSGIADSRGAACRPGPNQRQRAASGHRVAGAAIRVRPPRRPACRRRPGRLVTGVARSAGQHLRSPQSRRDCALRGCVRWCTVC